MKNIHQVHQAHFFTDNSDASTSPAMVMHLLNSLSDYSLLPTYGHEINPFLGERRPVIIMVDTSEQYKVEFGSQAIVITSETGSHQDFVSFSNGVFEKLKSTFPQKKAYRLSMSCNAFYTESVEKYQQLYERIFTHYKARPIEWENRIVERDFILDEAEEINSISVVKRLEIRSPKIRGGLSTDCIIFESESNTIPQNNNLRFDLGDCQKFFNELHANNERLLNSLSRYM